MKPFQDHTAVVLTLLLLLDRLCSTLAVQYVTNETESGTVRGFRETVLDKDLDIFLGIPYAKPPIGKRRFKHPESISRWDGIKDATQFPNACFQATDTMYGKFEGVDMWNPNTPVSEDCLYLNIWAPADRPFGKLRGVLVWIYGGSFTSGSISLDVYDGRLLAAQGDVILVSVNYRLGVFGFLHDGTDDIPGNMGLFDQTMALQWIYNNINAFGGDNRRITIFGESAGSVSCSLLLMSPLSQGFVNSAILLSGTAASAWAWDPTWKAKSKFNTLADLVDCKKENTSTYDCLMETDAALIADKTWQITDHSKVPTPLAPIIDGEFLTNTPQRLLETGMLKRAPILLGSVADEGTYFFMYAPEYIQHFKLHNNHFSNNTYLELISAVINNRNRALIDLVNFQYRQPEHFTPNSPAVSTQDYINTLDDIFTDKTFICHMLSYSRAQTAAGNPVYMYMYEHRTSANPWPEWMGVMHGYEIDHVFGAPLNASLEYHPEETILSTSIIRYWTNFVKSGNPNHGESRAVDVSVEWPVYTLEHQDYLVLDTPDSTVAHGLRDKYCRFWGDVYPQLESQLSGDWEPCSPQVTASSAPAHHATLPSCLLLQAFFLLLSLYSIL